MIKTDWWIQLKLIIVLVVGWGIRLCQLEHLSIWLDEAYSIYTAQQEWYQAFKFMAAMEHPPLYFMILRCIIALAGENEFSYRFLSVVSGMLSIVGMYTLAKQVADKRLALVAALLTALSPFHIWYSRDARMYELFFALSILSSALFLYNLEHLDKLGWLGYGLISLAGLYTLNMMLFVFLVQLAYFFVYFRLYRHKIRVLSLVLASICAGYTPWIPVLLIQSWHVNQYFWISRPTWQTLRDTMLNFFSAFLFSNSPWHPSVGPWPYNLVYWVFGGSMLLGAFFLIRQKKFGAIIWMGLSLSLPIGIIYIISLFKPMYLDRTVIFSSAGTLLLIAGGCSGGVSRWTRALGMGLLTVVLVVNSVSLYNLINKGEKEEWRQVAQFVAEKSQSEDIVLVDSGLSQIPFDLYFARYGLNIRTYGYPLDNNHWQTQSLTWGSRWWILDFMQPDLARVQDRLTKLFANCAGRIWLIINRPLGGQSLQTILERHSQKVPQVYHFNRIDVVLYQ